MDLTGKIIAVLPASSGVSQRTGNSWMSQDYVIEVPGQFPRKCVFRVFGEDRIKQFNIQMGEDLTVSFDIDAHEFNGRWFNDVRAFNVTRGAMPVAVAPGVAPAQASPGTQCSSTDACASRCFGVAFQPRYIFGAGSLDQ